MREAIIKAVVNAPAKKTLAINAQLSKDPYTPEACYKDVSDFVWEPTVRNRRLTEDEMAIQREFLKAAAVKAGLKNYTAGGSTLNAFAADDAGREAFSAFAQPAPLCSCAGVRTEPRPTATPCRDSARPGSSTSHRKTSR